MAKKDKGEEKTNVMRLLDASLIPYVPRFYDPELTSGTDVAAARRYSRRSMSRSSLCHSPGIARMSSTVMSAWPPDRTFL